MKLIILSLTIVVSLVLPSLPAPSGEGLKNEWFDSTSNIIRMKCDGLDHDVEIAWDKFGKLALSIPNTKMDGIVKLTQLATAPVGDYKCIARVYKDNEILAATRITIHPQFNLNNEGFENFQIPTKSEIKCQAAGSNKPNIFLDWKNPDYSPVSRRTTVFGGFNTTDVAADATNEYTCSISDDSQIGCNIAKTYVEMISRPVITLLPREQWFEPGANAVIVCHATGEGPITIEWYAIGRDLPASSWNSVGVLYLNRISAEAAGKYVCNATNDGGSTLAVFQVINDESHCT